jgi:hypothetical protein
MDGSANGQGKASEKAKKERWFQRPTVRSLKKKAEQYESDITRKGEERDNEETRLPASEEIHLGGLVLTEAFTPSTVSALYRVIEGWPTNNAKQRNEWLEELASSRAGLRSGWQNLGVVRPPGAFGMGDETFDAQLPSGVEAVWLHVSYVTPALAMVVATFTLTEDAGDFSELLRQNYRSKRFDARLQVYGRFGGMRARIPWSRPARYRLGTSVHRAEDEKRVACEELISQHEDECSRWFFGKFPGRFAAAAPKERPAIRMLFTKDQTPYQERHHWLRPVGLDSAYPLWRCVERDGWWLSEDERPFRSGTHVMTLAGKRADAAEKPGTGPETGESNWFLTQSFGSDQAPLAARHALVALLAIYSNRLSGLRDKAAVRRLLRRPVREGRNLDDYLIADGLDAATVTSDLEAFTDDLTMFRWDVPEFTEYRENLPKGSRNREPMEFVPALRDGIRRQAARLASDSKATTENIKASAELRQAIANTRLQRFTMLLSAVAAILAVIGILIQSP